MTNFNVIFQVKGLGEVTLPVTPLDSLILSLDGSVAGTFRFSVENILSRDIPFNVLVATNSDPASKISISVDKPTLTIKAGQSEVITATVTPSVPLVETDVILVSISGQEVV